MGKQIQRHLSHGLTRTSPQKGLGGFTIIEVMIVLAVTGAMFLGASLLIAGRTNQTEFTQAIEQVQSQIQQTIDDVINGYYPNNGSFGCQPGNPNVVINPGSTEQGQNGGCIFLGKVMQFAVATSSTPSNQPFNIYSIVGSQCALGTALPSCNIALGTGNISTSLSNAEPTVLLNSGQNIDLTDSETLENGLSATAMYYDGNTANRTGAVGFLQTLGTFNSCSGTATAGNQQVCLWAIVGTNLNQSKSAATAAINNSANWQAASDVEICFPSATTVQSGLISIGGNGRQLSVSLKTYSDTSCS